MPRAPFSLPVFAAPDRLPSPAHRHALRGADRTAHLALPAAEDAWQEARLDELPPARIALVIGSSRGPVSANLGLVTNPLRPTQTLHTTFSSIAGVLADAFGLEGGATTVSATCTASATALDFAVKLLQTDDADAVLVGGVDAPLVDPLLEQFHSTGVLATDPELFQPFGMVRSGTVLGEGAAFVVLEKASAVEKRGGRIHATIRSIALGNKNRDRAGVTRGSSGLEKVMTTALTRASVAPCEIDLLHVHGTGTSHNDVTESICAQAIFGPPDSQPWSWASKMVTGHTLGASALFQTALSLMAFRHDFIPASHSWAKLDPACPVRLTQTGIEKPLRKAMVINSGFWGTVSAILLERP